MKESFFLLLLMYLSNINDHFPETNDYNKNTFVSYNNYITIGENTIIFLHKMYNDYGINVKRPIVITDLSSISYLENTTQIYSIESDSMYLITDKIVLEKAIDNLKYENFYNQNSCVILLLPDNVLNDLSSEEVKKYKQVTHCYILTYSNPEVFNELIAIKDNRSKLKQMELNISITYSNYPTVGYAIFISILFIIINTMLVMFIKGYLKLENRDKLGIHLIIVMSYFVLDLCLFFTFVEVLLSKECLSFKLIPQIYYVVKVIKVIFFLIEKNSIMLIFLLIFRAYCTLFFDDAYKNKYIKLMGIIALVDFFLQLVISLFDSLLLNFIYIIDLYNIIYYSSIGIYIYMRGKNISIFLKLLITRIEQNNNMAWTPEELISIREVIKVKIKLRKHTIILCFSFCLIGIISPFLYLLFQLKGNTIYDLIILTQSSTIICLISRVFYPKQLLNLFTIAYEQLINGIPEEFLNEYFFKFQKNHYIKDAFNFNITKNSPVIVIYSNNLIKNDINNLNKENYYGENLNPELINSFFEKGKIGFMSSTLN